MKTHEFFRVYNNFILIKKIKELNIKTFIRPKKPPFYEELLIKLPPWLKRLNHAKRKNYYSAAYKTIKSS